MANALVQVDNLFLLELMLYFCKGDVEFSKFPAFLAGVVTSRFS
ncbi:hypothetical protein F652_915 [Enterobacteriaceae bacterium bta3-1]|nr:hypothetical protein F652_915 [Enterobacteriaceae bacterium bta3-1]